MIQRIREWLALILIGILPFHALFVTMGTEMIADGGAPLWWMAVWKEALLVLILCVVFIEIGRKFAVHSSQFTTDVLDWLIIGFLILGTIVSIVNGQLLMVNYQLALGVKYTLFPLFLFLILRRVPWSEEFRDRAIKLILLIGGVVVGYGLVSLLLPHDFFTWLGYSPLHSLYIPQQALAPFQYIEKLDIRRMQSTFSGPNQLGMWLLLPWSAALVSLFRCLKEDEGVGGRIVHVIGRHGHMCVRWMYLLLIGTGLFLTFSRAALLSAVIIVAVAAWRLMERESLRRFTVWAGFGLAVVGMFLMVMRPGWLIRSVSTYEHVRRPVAALRLMMEHPFGLGLGTVGPASNRLSDPCVYLEEGDDVSWARVHPNLCVFVGETQVQPNAPCSCPLLTENWYLQVGVELGIAGFILFILLVLAMIRALQAPGPKLQMTNKSQFSKLNFQNICLFTWLGLSIAALFLHAWESAAISYTVWILMAASLYPKQGDH